MRETAPRLRPDNRQGLPDEGICGTERIIRSGHLCKDFSKANYVIATETKDTDSEFPKNRRVPNGTHGGVGGRLAN